MGTPYSNRQTPHSHKRWRPFHCAVQRLPVCSHSFVICGLGVAPCWCAFAVCIHRNRGILGLLVFGFIYVDSSLHGVPISVGLRGHWGTHLLAWYSCFGVYYGRISSFTSGGSGHIPHYVLCMSTGCFNPVFKISFGPLDLMSTSTFLPLHFPEGVGLFLSPAAVSCQPILDLVHSRGFWSHSWRWSGRAGTLPAIS